jgi:hypothetical protein
LTEQDVIKLIGEKLTGLEYLGIGLKFTKAEDAVAELKKYFPSLRGVIKEVQGCFGDHNKKSFKF